MSCRLHAGVAKDASSGSESGIDRTGDLSRIGYPAVGAVIIDDQRCQKAIDYLIKTDELSAQMKTDVAAKEYALDLAKKRVFLTADGNVEERKAIAETSADVQTAVEAHCKSLLAFERVRARRTTAALIVDTWRSVNANRRSGNV